MNTITLLVACGIVGVADTLYLIYHKMRGTDVACPFFPREWCRTVQYSSYSTTLGVPNSIAGLGMYTALLVLVWLYVGGTIAFLPIQALVTFGFLFSLYFTYVQAFVLRAFCTWCVVSAVNFTILFISVWYV
jgi:uncharacterized membrane protein